MRLLDFVEQDHRVRLAADSLGQITALLVADITRRRTDQPRHRMFFHELGHVDADQVILGIKHELGQCLAQLGFADTCRPKKEERTIRPVRIAKTRARTTDGIGHQAHGLILPHHAAVQAFFHFQQFFALTLHHFGHRNAG